MVILNNKYLKSLIKVSSKLAISVTVSQVLTLCLLYLHLYLLSLFIFQISRLLYFFFFSFLLLSILYSPPYSPRSSHSLVLVEDVKKSIKQRNPHSPLYLIYPSFSLSLCLSCANFLNGLNFFLCHLTKIRIDDDCSVYKPICRGVRQGCVFFSPWAEY